MATKKTTTTQIRPESAGYSSSGSNVDRERTSLNSSINDYVRDCTHRDIGWASGMTDDIYHNKPQISDRLRPKRLSDIFEI